MRKKIIICMILASLVGIMTIYSGCTEEQVKKIDVLTFPIYKEKSLTEIIAQDMVINKLNWTFGKIDTIYTYGVNQEDIDDEHKIDQDNSYTYIFTSTCENSKEGIKLKVSKKRELVMLKDYNAPVNADGIPIGPLPHFDLRIYKNEIILLAPDTFKLDSINQIIKIYDSRYNIDTIRREKELRIIEKFLNNYKY